MKPVCVESAWIIICDPMLIRGIVRSERKKESLQCGEIIDIFSSVEDVFSSCEDMLRNSESNMVSPGVLIILPLLFDNVFLKCLYLRCKYQLFLRTH